MSTSPPPQPPISTPPTPDTYTQLLTALHPSSPSILEIDILPSTFPSLIHIDPPTLALPWSLLAKLYLTARHTFFSAPQSLQHGKVEFNAQLRATRILLLFDPNHLTAANHRKRYILHAATNPSQLAEALSHELAFLTSLLTSPLPKHTKSSTLWSHRLWLFQTFPDTLMDPETKAERDILTSSGGKIRVPETVWTRELHIVMKAGERHPRNYYAWNYAKLLSCILIPSFENYLPVDIGKHEDILVGTARELHKWCLMHPRDISGWAFLVFWLRKMQDGGARLEDARSSQSVIKGECSRVVRDTREWVMKYDWKGESAEWFMKAALKLGHNEQCES